ncbi:MAG: sugar nucleotide-binding protein [Ignavibacteria bacterium]|nr:sugar nucleotide-binding protein [Ignavibacteria bacterium]
MFGPSKKIFIIGGTGLVGEAILEMLSRETEHQISFSSSTKSLYSHNNVVNHEIASSDFKALRKTILAEKPEVIINASGISNPEICKTQKQLCWALNVSLVEHLVSISKILDSHLITFSCESIFNGKIGFCREDNRVEPCNYIGKTKLAAENTISVNLTKYTIIRLPLVYGVNGNGRKDFVQNILDQLKEGQTIELPSNVLTNPVFAEDVAWGVMKVIDKNAYGLFHFGGNDWVSLFEFGLKIAKIFNYPLSLIKDIAHKEPKYLGLQQSLSEAILMIKFSSVIQGLITYQNLIKERLSPFESYLQL